MINISQSFQDCAQFITKLFLFRLKAINFFVFLFCDHLTIKGAKRLFEKMSLDHEVPGCLICKILAKRFGAHQEEVLNQVGHILL